MDEKISKVRSGASVVEVIQLLGKPDDASETGRDGMAFVYKGRKTYSVVFSSFGGITSVIKVYESEIGGPIKIDVVVNGDMIEFKRSLR